MTGPELRARRAALGLTLDGLARALELPKDTLWRWETGKFPIRHGRLMELAMERLAQLRGR